MNKRARGASLRATHMTQEAACARINAQNNDAFYTGRADYVIENNGDEDALRFAFMDLMEKLERRARGRGTGFAAARRSRAGRGRF